MAKKLDSVKKNSFLFYLYIYKKAQIVAFEFIQRRVIISNVKRISPR